MDDEIPIPLEGKLVYVRAYLIEQAYDLISRGKEIVAFARVGSQAVSVYTGKPQRLITHDVEQETPPFQQMRGGRVTPPPKKKTAAQKRKQGIRPKSAIDVDALQVLDFLSRVRARALSAKEIGDQMGFPRKDAAKRQTLSRMIAELRVSGLVRTTAEERVPDYQFAEEIPQFHIDDISNFNLETVLDFMRQVRHPLAFGVIGDLFQISRHDRTQRYMLAMILNELVSQQQLTVSTEQRMKIPVYSLP